jgi:metal-dependent amidase/aminoacylase/carboxypeptidase family protein
MFLLPRLRLVCQRAGIRRRGQGAARQGRPHRGREVLDAAAARRTMPTGGAKGKRELT